MSHENSDFWPLLEKQIEQTGPFAAWPSHLEGRGGEAACHEGDTAPSRPLSTHGWGPLERKEGRGSACKRH